MAKMIQESLILGVANSTIFNQGSDQRIFLFSVQELLDSLFGYNSNLSYLRQPPPLSPCKDENRRTGHMAYYRKLLIYHPSIALHYMTQIDKASYFNRFPTV